MSERVWAVVPAAGSGRRMGGALPKQYLRVAGRTLLEHSLRALAAHPAVEAIVVAISADDPHWDAAVRALDTPLWVAPGGAERCHSVLNGLTFLRARAAIDDWVLVHDAARPCLRRGDLDRLIDAARGHPSGGLLAVPAKDTMKRAGANLAVEHTVARGGLWHALTPQMFRLGPLHDAIEQALEAGGVVTDESSAMEYMGHHPLLVEGHADNIKITRPEDLPLAEFFLSRLAKDS